MRPLKIEFTKESEQKIQTDYEILKLQIDNISPYNISIEGKNVTFYMRVHPTMWDCSNRTSSD